MTRFRILEVIIADDYLNESQYYIEMRNALHYLKENGKVTERQSKIQLRKVIFCVRLE